MVVKVSLKEGQCKFIEISTERLDVIHDKRSPSS